MNNPSLSLTRENRVFLMSADPKPGCIVGQTVAGFANEYGAILLMGSSRIPFRHPIHLRALANNIITLAERIEMAREINN